MIPVRNILAATDLTPRDDRVIRSAARLAHAFSAQLHVVFVAPPWEGETEARHLAELTEQVRRCLGDEEEVDAAVVYDRPFHGLLVHAASVGADLIVLGAHRGSGTSARWRGTTAERVVRSADVPCLVVDEELTLPVRHVGVSTDFSPASRGAALLIAEWMPLLNPDANTSTLTLVSGDSAGEGHAARRLDQEVERLREMTDTDGQITVRTEDLRVASGGGAVEVAVWADTSDVDLLVVCTEGRRGWERVWHGSHAIAMTMESLCPVLLIPDALWRRSPISLARIATTVGAHEDEGRPRVWLEHRVAHAQRPLELIDLDPEDDPVQQARDVAADLLVVHPSAPTLSPDLEDLLEHTPIPVLVLRNLPDGPIRHILVAVDTGDIWYEKFGWTKLLADRFDADITVFHAIDLSISSRVRREPGGEFVPSVSVWMKDDVERTVVPAMRTWLWERVRLAGLPPERVEVIVGLQDPWYAIPTLAQRMEADLVVIAAHADGTVGPSPLSRVARATLGGGTYSTLVVVDRAKREAEWAEAIRVRTRINSATA